MPNATAADIIYIKPRTGTALPEGALPAAVEYLTAHGTACWFLSAVPASALLARPEVAALGPLASLKLVQEREEDGPAHWAMYLRGPDMDVAPLVLPMEEAEVQRALEANSLTLPVPQPMAIDLAPEESGPDAPPPPEDRDAPPFDL